MMHFLFKIKKITIEGYKIYKDIPGIDHINGVNHGYHIPGIDYIPGTN